MSDIRYRKKTELYLGEIEEDQVILRDEYNKKTHVLNVSAAEIWNMCENITKSDLCTNYLLGFKFENLEAENVAKQAVLDTIDLLIQEELIVYSDALDVKK